MDISLPPQGHADWHMASYVLTGGSGFQVAPPSCLLCSERGRSSSCWRRACQRTRGGSGISCHFPPADRQKSQVTPDHQKVSDPSVRAGLHHAQLPEGGELQSDFRGIISRSYKLNSSFLKLGSPVVFYLAGQEAVPRPCSP